MLLSLSRHAEVPKPDSMSYEDVLVKYVLDAYKSRSKYGRPVINYNDTLTVEFAMQLTQIVDLDEQDQVLTLNVWDQYVSMMKLMKNLKWARFPWSPWLKWPRTVATHTLSHGSNAFTHTLTSTQLQLRGAKRQLSYYFSVRAGSFRVSVIHRNLPWTTGSLSCLRHHSCACVPGVGHTDSESAQHFWLGKFHKYFLCSWRDSNLCPLDPIVRRSTNWATPSPCTHVNHGSQMTSVHQVVYRLSPPSNMFFFGPQSAPRGLPKDTACHRWKSAVGAKVISSMNAWPEYFWTIKKHLTCVCGTCVRARVCVCVWSGSESWLVSQKARGSWGRDDWNWKNNLLLNWWASISLWGNFYTFPKLDYIWQIVKKSKAVTCRYTHFAKLSH